MKTPLKIAIVAALVVLVAGAVALKDRNNPVSSSPAATVAAKPLPKLLDLGAGKCIPCKMMAPILEGLKKEYAAVFTTEFIDVWQDENAGKKYGIETIPTQIFLDATGKELFRHTGFFSKEDILAKWKELGVK
jgi:thioredoxin 1